MVSSNIVYRMFNIPIKITNLHKSDSSKMKQISPCCNIGTGLKTICKGCGNELVKSDLLKGFPLDKENIHIITQEQNNALKDFDKVVEVIGKISKSEIDMKKICGAFLVTPDKKQVKMFKKAYKVFEQGISNSNDAIVVKFATSSKQKIGILTSMDNVLVLLQVVYEENFNDIVQIPEIEISEAEIKQGVNFVEKLDAVDISTIENEYNKRLYEFIEKGEPLTITVPQVEEKDELGFFNQ